MPDITMCPAKNCPLKEKCYRAQARPAMLQAYYVNEPYDFEKNTCAHLLKIEDYILNKEIKKLIRSHGKKK